MPSLEMPSGEMNEISAPPTIECGDPEENGEKPTYGPMPLVTKLSSGRAEANGQVEMAGEWTKWQDLKGCCISSPAAASWGQDRLDVFAIGTNSQLYHKQWDGEWSKWISLGGTCIYKPAAVSWGENRLDVFAIGIDKQVYRKWWDGSKWNGWENLGGTCIHGIAAASWGPGRIDLFTVGTNSVVYHNSFADNEWQGWRPLKLKNQDDWEKSSTSIGAPAAVASKQDCIDVFTLGVDNHVYHAWGDGESWEGWQDLGGQAIQGVAAASRGECLDLFTISTDDDGTDNHLYHRVMKAGTWSDWENLGGVCVSAPAAVAVGDDRVDAFVVGTRSALYQKTWSPNAEISGGVDVATLKAGQVIFSPAELMINSWRLPPATLVEVEDFEINLSRGPKYWLFLGSRKDVIAVIAKLKRIYFGELEADEYGTRITRGYIGVRTYNPRDEEARSISEMFNRKAARIFMPGIIDSFEELVNCSWISDLYSSLTAAKSLYDLYTRVSSTPNITVFQITNKSEIRLNDIGSPIRIFWDQPSVLGYQAASVLATYWEVQDSLTEKLTKTFSGPEPSYQAIGERLLQKGKRFPESDFT